MIRIRSKAAVGKTTSQCENARTCIDSLAELTGEQGCIYSSRWLQEHLVSRSVANASSASACIVVAVRSSGYDSPSCLWQAYSSLVAVESDVLSPTALLAVPVVCRLVSQTVELLHERWSFRRFLNQQYSVLA